MVAITIAPVEPVTGLESRPGRWIDRCEPEDPEFWQSTGRSVARRNLLWSIFGEHFGFSV